ncbi:MAG: SDR family oxidoreductase [Proteobacteria bacterium]|nr:SDR family oxidoreductase [Pseudomonadota bacterium]
MQSLEGRHALVTGGATGIGLAITKSLRSAGARVTIASRNIERVKAVAAELDGVTGVQLDVTDAADISAVFEQAGPVDILVNNAGIAHAAAFEKTSLEQWSKIMAVNLTGVFLCTQAVLASMRERNEGRIINIASTAGLKGAPYISAYAASKHGLIGMTQSLALEFATTGITANCVCPGFTDTQMVDDAVTNITSKTGRSGDEALAKLVQYNPQKRLITPEEVADTVLWLCQDSSRSITGQSIVIGGGEIT